MLGTDDAAFPFWSPDNRHIGFFAQGKLKKIASNGDPAQSLCDAPDGRGASWGRDNVIVFSHIAGGAIRRVSAGGGVPVDLAGRGGLPRFPIFLPDGRHFFYLMAGASVGQNGTYLRALDDKDNHRVLADVSSVVFTSGRLLFIRENTLMAQPFDAARAQTVGEAFPVEGFVSGTEAINQIQNSFWGAKPSEKLSRLMAPA